MKLVRPGRPWWTDVEGACLECGAEFLLEADDRPADPDRAPASRLDGDQFRCPSCGALVLVVNPADDAPPPGLIVGI